MTLPLTLLKATFAANSCSGFLNLKVMLKFTNVPGEVEDSSDLPGDFSVQVVERFRNMVESAAIAWA